MKSLAFPTRSPRRARRGAALILALSSVAVVSVLAVGILLMLSTESRSHSSSLDRTKSFYLAEAGLAEAYAGLALGRTGNVGTEEAPAVFGQGLFWTEAEEVAQNRVQVVSTGMSGSQRVQLSFVAERSVLTATVLGVFASQDLTVQPGSLIDGYDSTLGTYAEQAAQGLEATQAGQIAGNGDITLFGAEEMPTLINGDAAPGPEGVLNQDRSSQVTGEVVAAEAAVSPTPVTPPDIALMPGVRVSGDAPPVVLAAGDYGFQSLLLAEGARLEVAGPSRLLIGDLGLRGESELVFDTSGGRIDVYVTGQLLVSESAQLGVGNEDPTQVTVQVAGDGALAWETSEPFYGTLYAPEATLVAGEGFELFGSVIASELVLGEGARLHFDRALLAQAAGESALPELVAWRIVDLGPEGGAGTGSPFDRLGVDRATLSGPSESHEDQYLELTYVDQVGLTQSYAGMESSFDWSLATEVVSLARDGQLVAMGAPSADDADTPPAEISPDDQAVLDDIRQDPPPETGLLMNRLLNASPLSATVLVELASLSSADQPLSEGNLKLVLEANNHLAGDELYQYLSALFNNPDPATGNQLDKIMSANSPLNTPDQAKLLKEMLLGPGNTMSSAENADVLIAHSPLDPEVLTLVTGGSTSLSPTDIAAVLAAQ